MGDPQSRLLKVLFVINYLCVFGETSQPPAIIHNSFAESKEKGEVWVKYKDPKTGQWQDPAKVIYWGRGYLCVSTPTGNIWVPSRWTKPALNVPDTPELNRGRQEED